jgi:hypothetical protein
MRPLTGTALAWPPYPTPGESHTLGSRAVRGGGRPMRNHLFLSLYATAATAGCAASARGRDVAGFAVLMTERGTSVGG